MRDVLKRIEKLECRVNPPAPPRVVRTIIQFVKAENGKPAPWNPTRASTYDHGDAIERDPEETIEAFELRASAHFPGSFLIA